MVGGKQSSFKQRLHISPTITEHLNIYLLCAGKKTHLKAAHRRALAITFSASLNTSSAATVFPAAISSSPSASILSSVRVSWVYS